MKNHSLTLDAHLLLVDDEPHIRKTLFKILDKNTPHTIKMAEDGQDGFEKWEAAHASDIPYDLIVVDLRMPRMDGETLIQEIRKNDSDVALIVLTGHGQLNDAYALLKEYQISDFLNKPLQSPLQLLFSVENALEKRRLKQELQRLNADKDKFFSIISHDLRNPLSGLMGYAELMVYRGHTYPPEKIQEHADNILSAAKNINNLLENLLHWSRIQTGRITYQPTVVDLYQEAKNTVLLYQANAEEKDIILLSTIEPSITAYADRNMVDMVIRNLVSNAIKFTDTGGAIKVLAEDKGTTVEVMVSDTGVGMHEEQIQSLFKIDVFQTTMGTNNEIGSGLGLILCREMVEQNNGTIWVESEPHRGTTFHVSLPKHADTE